MAPGSWTGYRTGGRILNSVLVIRFSAMGDILLTTPSIRILRKHFPDASIDFLVKEKYEPLLRYNPHLTTLWTFRAKDREHGLSGLLRALNRRHYDGVVDLQSSLRSLWLTHLLKSSVKCRYTPLRWKRLLLVHFNLDTYGESNSVPLRYLEALKDWGIEDDGGGLELYPGEAAKERLSDMLHRSELLPDDHLLAMAPGASRLTKRWIPEGFARVGDHFQKKAYRVVLIGGPDDVTTCSEISDRMQHPPVNLSGRLALLETAALLERSDLLVSNDTGVMHMAAALKTPLVALFGPTSIQLGFMPFRARSSVVESEIDCRPCSYHGSNRCPKSHFLCMRLIKHDEVIQKAEALLQGAKEV